jgi:branched-chain amino acid transport system permease protein
VARVVDEPAEVAVAEAIREDPLHAALDPRTRWWPSPAGVVARLSVIGLLGLLLALIPHWVPAVQVNIVARAAVFGIVALSMNVLMGYAGQISLGHQAFVGVGAFTAAYVLSTMAMPYPMAMLASIATGALTALLLGGVALRVRGLYLALVTIAYGLFAQEVIFNIRALTGGGAGLEAPRPSWFAGDIAYVYFCFAVLAVVLVFDWRLTSSKAGRAIQALRDDERVAASWGINVTGFKLLAFVISGSLAGLAGALFAGIEQVVTPVDFSFTLGLTFVLMTVVGGLRVRSGVVQGGIFFAILPTLLDESHTRWHVFPFTVFDALWEPLIGALLLILTLVQFPGGIAQQQEHLRRWLSFGPFQGHGHGTGGGSGGGGARGGGAGHGR